MERDLLLLILARALLGSSVLVLVVRVLTLRLLDRCPLCGGLRVGRGGGLRCDIWRLNLLLRLDPLLTLRESGPLRAVHLSRRKWLGD